MAVEILIHAIDHAKAWKGQPQTVRPAGWVWGNKEGPPNYIVLEIPDATVAQVDNFLDNWRDAFTYTLIRENPQGRRYDISVHPMAVQLFGSVKGVRQEMLDYLETIYGANVINVAADRLSARIDIPNTDWQALRDDVLDKFESLVHPRRYQLNPTDVDAALAAGGRITMTRAVAQTRVIDRLA